MVGKGMTAELALNLGASAGTFWKRGIVAVGTDCRDSGRMLSKAVTAGLNSAGLDVADLGRLPTPALQFYVRGHRLAGGIVVTASHNPPEFNGLKCVSADGTEMARQEEEAIEGILSARKFAQADWTSIGSSTSDSSANAQYVEGVVRSLKPRKALDMRVMVDCGNGASTFTTPPALRKLGCEVETLNAQPDGAFPGRPSEPTEGNVGDLVALCGAGGFDMGVAHDGDADRATFVDEKGAYISGDLQLTLMASLACRRAGGGKVVVPIDTSRAVQEAVEREGGTVVYTKVGSPIIARRMMAEKAVLGGEANGGIIFPQFQFCRDGLFAAASLAKEIAEGGVPLSRLASGMPRRSMRRLKVPCPMERFGAVLAALDRELSADGSVEGLLVEGKGHWALFRPSGTEPIMRLTLESARESELPRLVERYSASLKAAVESASGPKRRQSRR